MKADKPLYQYLPLKEPTPLTEENTILTLFYSKLDGTDIDPIYHVRSHLPANMIESFYLDGGTMNTPYQTSETQRNGYSMTRNVKAMWKMKELETCSNGTRL